MLRMNQLKLLWLLLAILTLSIIFRVTASQLVNSDDMVVHRNVTDEAINPNTADWTSLARLPGIGEAKAKAIVNYREEQKQSMQKNTLIFSTSDDLKAVKGLGEKTVRSIEPFLIFSE